MRYTSKQYARAIRSAVGTVGEFRAIIDELKAVADIFMADATAIKYFMSRVVPIANRVSTLERMIGDVLRPDTARTLLLLTRNEQFRELSSVVRVASRIADTEEGIARVSIISANPIPAAVRKHIESTIVDRLRKRVIAVYTEEASVLGGFRVTVDGSACWDGTTARRLQKLAACLAASTALQS